MNTEETKPPVVTFRESIAVALSTVSADVEARVVDAYVEREVAKRADAIVKGLDELGRLDRELGKTDRADVVTYNADGSKATETFSKARLDEIDKLRKRRAKLAGALDKALGGDLGDLLNLTSGKPTADASED